jgi:hypothetical protein
VSLFSAVGIGAPPPWRLAGAVRSISPASKADMRVLSRDVPEAPRSV